MVLGCAAARPSAPVRQHPRHPHRARGEARVDGSRRPPSWQKLEVAYVSHFEAMIIYTAIHKEASARLASYTCGALRSATFSKMHYLRCTEYHRFKPSLGGVYGEPRGIEDIIDGQRIPQHYLENPGNARRTSVSATDSNSW